MSYATLYQTYLGWAEVHHIDPLPPERLMDIPIMTREIEDTPHTHTAEMTFVVPTRTNNLYLFTFTEITRWVKDSKGDTGHPEGVAYRVEM